MSIKINRQEEGCNSYPLVCRRPAETVPIQRRQICYRWGAPAYWSLVFRSIMFYLFEFCLKNMWNCSLTHHIMSHCFYDWKLCEWFLYSGILICHAVRWYTEFKNQKSDGERSWFKIIQKIFNFSKSTCVLFHYARKQFHNISLVPVLNSQKNTFLHKFQYNLHFLFQFNEIIKTRHNMTHLILSLLLVTNQSVQAINGYHQIIFFATSLNSTFFVSGVKWCVTWRV